MLVSEKIGNRVAQFYHCLDLMQVRFDGRSRELVEDAILLEVWATGGLLQTERDAQSGSYFRLTRGKEGVHAQVVSCCKDDYGYLVEFAVDPGQRWFPQSYQPPYLLA